jgi:hypothetical protein
MLRLTGAPLHYRERRLTRVVFVSYSGLPRLDVYLGDIFSMEGAFVRFKSFKLRCFHLFI